MICNINAKQNVIYNYLSQYDRYNTESTLIDEINLIRNILLSIFEYFQINLYF